MEKMANTSKSRAEDLSGQTFGRLTAIRRVPAPNAPVVTSALFWQ